MLTLQAWEGMKTTGQLRRERSEHASYPCVSCVFCWLHIAPMFVRMLKHRADSAYKTIQRKPKKFAPERIPKTLQAKLPFKSKPKVWRQICLPTELLFHYRTSI